MTYPPHDEYGCRWHLWHEVAVGIFWILFATVVVAVIAYHLFGGR